MLNLCQCLGEKFVPVLTLDGVILLSTCRRLNSSLLGMTDLDFCSS